jgi:hypothetical protein
MAKLKGGILGDVYGKVGNIVGSNWYGDNVIRAYNGSPRNPQTALQTGQRSLFKRVTGFLRSGLPAIKDGYTQTATDMPAYSKAVGNVLTYCRDNGVTAEAFSVANFPLSQGSLPQPTIATLADQAAGGNFDVGIGPNSELDGKPVTVVMYNDATGRKQFRYALQDGPIDPAVEVTVTVAGLDQAQTGDTIHVWLWTSDSKSRQRSESVYGSFSVT